MLDNYVSRTLASYAEGRRVELLRGYKPSFVFKTNSVANRIDLPYVGEVGLEPTTSALSEQHSNRLSYTPLILRAPAVGIEPTLRGLESLVLPLYEADKCYELPA